MKNNHPGAAFCALPLLVLPGHAAADTPSTGKKTQEPSRPNIVYILADDMGFGDVRVLNDSCRIPTPTLDRMAAQGIVFTDAHTNSAVSTPTRYGTLTGRYAFRSRLKSGVLVGHDPSLIEPGRETVGSLLRANGYHTACIGKWHLGLDWARKDTTRALYEGPSWDMSDTRNIDYAARVGGGPADCGFDYSYILPASLDIAPYVYIENGYVTAPVTRHVPAWRDPQARGMWYRHGDIGDDFSHQTCLQTFTARATDYIRSRAGQNGQPFFLYLPLTAPHTPWLPSDEFRGRSGAGVYGDFVCMVDDAVRQVYQALEQSGQAENTIVIFTSDNGSHWLASDIKQFGHRANGPWAGGKSDIWEGGHRVPYIVIWPAGIKRKGQTSDRLVCSTDLMATCAEMLGVTLPDDAGEDSYSFWSVITGRKGDKRLYPERKNVIHHSIEGLFGYREGDWVLLECAGSGGWWLPEQQAHKQGKAPVQLYNLEKDPTETDNRTTQYPERTAAMQSSLHRQIDSGRSR